MTITAKEAHEMNEKNRQEDSKIVKGKFTCLEPKGGSVKFSYKAHKGDPIETYFLQDGKEYELPLGVAKHLNETGWDVHSNILDAQGNPMPDAGGKKVKRFIFQSLDFS